MSKIWLISDTHLNHDQIKTYCRRPDDYTERIDRNIRQVVRPDDTLIHLGDVFINKALDNMKIVQGWPGHKVLIRGNHDGHSCAWYIDNGFDFACDAMIFRSVWLTHKPARALPPGTFLNIHGHLHNVWDGFLADDPKRKEDEFTKAARRGRLMNPWQRLFAIEYTDYRPVEFDKFVNKPDRYQARGPSQKTAKTIQNWKQGLPSENVPDIECKQCFDEEGSRSCIRPAHAAWRNQADGSI